MQLYVRRYIRSPLGWRIQDRRRHGRYGGVTFAGLTDTADTGCALGTCRFADTVPTDHQCSGWYCYNEHGEPICVPVSMPQALSGLPPNT
jgi:hypothetical protein